MRPTFHVETGKRIKMNKNGPVLRCEYTLRNMRSLSSNREPRWVLASPHFSQLRTRMPSASLSLPEKPQPNTQATDRHRMLLITESTPHTAGQERALLHHQKFPEPPPSHSALCSHRDCHLISWNISLTTIPQFKHNLLQWVFWRREAEQTNIQTLRFPRPECGTCRWLIWAEWDQDFNKNNTTCTCERFVQASSHLIVTTRTYYCPHVIDKETEAQNLNNLLKWQHSDRGLLAVSALTCANLCGMKLNSSRSCPWQEGVFKIYLYFTSKWWNVMQQLKIMFLQPSNLHVKLITKHY